MATHVLVPVDGSEPSWEAFDYALSNYGESKITVLHVIDPVDPTDGLFVEDSEEGLFAPDEGGFFGSGTQERVRDATDELIEEARRRFADADLEDVTLETAVEPGRPARTIVDYADEHDVDGIVLGSHGREGVSRVLLGSVAETVTRRASVFVTVVR